MAAGVGGAAEPLEALRQTESRWSPWQCLQGRLICRLQSLRQWLPPQRAQGEGGGPSRSRGARALVDLDVALPLSRLLELEGAGESSAWAM